mmetsp:Transcript_76187/g.123796  ORF Transcript_76187/g.123796 Transcript_76187/m.123796 type:complete len:178 (+) Transcript_76187:63-596(+)
MGRTSVRGVLLAAACFAVLAPVWVLGKDEDHVIGIDLGTTYSCVGIYRNGQVEIVANDLGNRITPSWVAFTPEGEMLVGDAAKNQVGDNPENTLYDVKRILGRGFSDDTVKKDVKGFPFKITDKDGKPLIHVDSGGKKKNTVPGRSVGHDIGIHEKGRRGFPGQKSEKGRRHGSRVF